MIHGQSGYTRFKQLRFGPIFTQSLRISKAIAVSRFAYYHIDLNAGSGFNETVHVPGSPLNFLRAANREHRENFYAFFVDKEFQCIQELVKQPDIEMNAGRVAVFHADNSELLDVVREFVRARERRPACASGN